MQQIGLFNRQRSLSNNSSVRVPKFRRKSNDLNKDALYFSQIFNKQRNNGSSQNNNQQQKQTSEQNIAKYNKKSLKRGRQNNQEQNLKQKNKTPCPELFHLFKNHHISYQFVEFMQKHKFKHLVVVSIILPKQLMKKVSRLVDLTKQYKISMPCNLFTTQFIKLNTPHQGVDINYVFWMYEIAQAEQNNTKKSIKSPLNLNNRQSFSSGKNLKQSKHSDASRQQQQIYNTKRILIDIPQIVITTKKYIQRNPYLFFPGLDQHPGPHQLSSLNLHGELDLQKSLLLMDEQFPKQSDTSKAYKDQQDCQNYNKQTKAKSPQLRSSPYIQIQAEEQFYDEDNRQKQLRPILVQGQLQRIDTARSNQDFTQNRNYENHTNAQSNHINAQFNHTNAQSNHINAQFNHTNAQLQDRLQKDSIFKSVTFLQNTWFQNQSFLTSKSFSSQKQKMIKRQTISSNLQIQKSQKFKIVLLDEIRSALNKNYNYSKFCSSWLFLHYLSNCHNHHIHSQRINNCSGQVIAHPTQTYSGVLHKTLRSFRQQIQLRFYSRLQTQYKQMTDEATLRNLLRAIKKEEIVFTKKNIGTIVFPNLRPNSLRSSRQHIKDFDKVLNHHQTRVDKLFLNELQRQILSYMDRLQEQIYYQNNKQAMHYNQKLLESEYLEIVQAGFRRQKIRKKQCFQINSSLGSDQRPMLMSQNSNKRRVPSQSISVQLQNDFNEFIDAYHTKGIKVSSQMKTFSQFMEKNKQSYLKNVYQLTKQKKDYQKQGQEKQNKNKMIKILESEIMKIQQKRKQVRDKNQIIKKQIRSVDQRKESLQYKNSQVRRDSSRWNKLKDNQTGNFSTNSRFIGQNQKHLPTIEAQNWRYPDKTMNKSGTLSLEMSQRRRISQKQSNQKQSKKQGYGRFQRTTNKNIPQYKQDTQNLNNRQAMNQVSGQEKSSKKRCMHKCCQIM